VTTARLFLSGIRASGHHGARPGEKDEPQEFVVDLDVQVEVGDDDIAGTADYRGITETVRSIIEQRSFDLIESMAAAIANEVFAIDRISHATALIHKPNAASRLGIDGVAAAVTASAG
jgi:dihydroneopterin aldolase